MSVAALEYSQGVVLALVVTSFALPLVWYVLRRRQLLDQPNERSSHEAPTPRGAGVALLMGVVAGTSFAGLPLGALFGVVSFGLLGAVDDLRPRSAKLRVAVQAALALVVAWLLWREISPAAAAWFGVLGAAAMPIVVNTVNFMDGINGITAVHGVVFGTVYAVLLGSTLGWEWGVMGAALVGSSLAFFPWNFRKRALVFLGDSGSYMVGATVALLLIATTGFGLGAIVALAPLVIYLTDVLFTLVVRLTQGQHLMTAHRQHVYQRLVQQGWGHRSVTLFVGSLSLVAGVVAIATAQQVTPAWTSVGLLACLAVFYLLSPRLLERGRFHG